MMVFREFCTLFSVVIKIVEESESLYLWCGFDHQEMLWEYSLEERCLILVLPGQMAGKLYTYITEIPLKVCNGRKINKQIGKYNFDTRPFLSVF